LPRSGVEEILGQVEGLIVPSLWAEGLPTVALEALAASCLIILSSSIAAAASFVGSGAALTFDPDRSDALKEALAQARANQAELRRRAASLHAERFSSGVWLEGAEAIYREVAARA
jgi:glycosyltransferase involved in cell wall biosynthesis